MTHPADYIRPEPIDWAKASLADVARAVAEQRLPPVDQWNPTHCGHSDMVIKADGTWFHAGTPIGRPALVQLFSTILRREPDGSHVLVTPAEKLTIDVEDAPFLAVEVMSEGQGRDRHMAFRLQTGDILVAGPANSLRFSRSTRAGPKPYLRVRGSAERPLEALVGRSVFYELADWAIAERAEYGGQLGLWSNGAFFAFPAD